ncbi:hypothetical protein MPDQ_002831 [Monascus purpureus]|uniref:Transmembrane protein n=1 Tax=Monascus purpureus TaxID=5098 RepID=A0A507QJV0_MONPU|nr:hypothetical protein MPDQ_002831 [Monascus purpureus]BDD56549.1 hypothetical protein MAP00_001990 [Monascus purpureus]
MRKQDKQRYSACGHVESSDISLFFDLDSNAEHSFVRISEKQLQLSLAPPPGMSVRPAVLRCAFPVPSSFPSRANQTTRSLQRSLRQPHLQQQQHHRFYSSSSSPSSSQFKILPFVALIAIGTGSYVFLVRSRTANRQNQIVQQEQE